MSNIKKQSQNPDSFSYTSYSGKKETQSFELFDLDIVRMEVQGHITRHTAKYKALEVLPDEYKFDFYYEHLFECEKMICNWKGLNEAFFGLYPLDITEVKNWEDYQPILSDDIILKTNDLILKYDKGEITFNQIHLYQKEYIKDNFPLEWLSKEEIKTTQEEVFALFDKCLKNHSYQLTPQELDMFHSVNMPVQSSRWLINKLRSGKSKFDIDTYFNQFEITLQNNPQPIYKLCAPFNHQLSMNNIAEIELSDSGEVVNTRRVKNLESRIHILIQDKIENMFKDWFRKKYVGDTIRVVTIDDEMYFHTSRTRTALPID